MEGILLKSNNPHSSKLTRSSFQTWPRGCFHVAKHPDFPVHTPLEGHKVKGLGLIGPFQAKNRF